MFPLPGDPVERCKTRHPGFDGHYVEVATRQEATDWLRDNIDTSSKTVYSTLDDFRGNLRSSDITDPHQTAQIDTTVSEGLMGVGETGSVWVTDRSLGIAGAGLLTLNLVLLLERSRILPSIHDAYAALQPGSSTAATLNPELRPLSETAYGSFFSGPSATADIEAVHITGAQGPLSLTVLLIG